MASSASQSKNSVSSKKKSGFWYTIKNTSFGESRSYLFEYSLLLLLTGGLLYVITLMVESFYERVSLTLPMIAFSDTDVFLLSSLTVILPLVIILIQRTSEAERTDATVKNLAWRKIFLGIFLAYVSVWAVINSILFINTILDYLSNGLVGAADFNWELSLRYLVSSAILIITAWTFGNDYRYVSRDHFARLRHSYRYGLVVTALVIGLLFLVFPFRENRTAYADEQISNDLYAINSMVDSYNTQNSKLPSSLRDLTLSKEQEKRSKLYSYTYESKTGSTFSLCAQFNNAKSVAVDNQSTAGASLPNTNSHTSGLNCYDFTVTSSTPSQVEGANTGAMDDGTVPSSSQSVTPTIEPGTQQ